MTESTSTSNIDVVRSFYDNLASEETFPAALELMDDDFVVHCPPGLPWGRDYHGREGMIELITAVASTVSMAGEGPMEFYDAGDRVFVAAKGRYTSLKNGNSAVTSVVEVLTVRDGKLLVMDIYYKEPEAVAGLDAA